MNKLLSYLRAKCILLRLFFVNYALKKKSQHFGNKTVIYPPYKIGFLNKFSIGSHCCINPGVFINSSGGVEIGDGTILGPEVVIYSMNHNYKDSECIPFSRTDIYSRVTIGNNCWMVLA